MKKCDTCNGKGFVNESSSHNYDDEGNVIEIDYKELGKTCPDCVGSGKASDESDPINEAVDKSV